MKTLTARFLVIFAMFLSLANPSYSQPPVVTLTADKTIVCLGEEVTFYQSSTGNIDTYSWDFGNGTTLNTEGPHTLTYNSAGSFTITLVATGPDGSSTATLTVQVNPPTPGAPISITGPQAICAQRTGLIYSAQPGMGIIYEWTVSSGVTITSGAGTSSITVDIAPGVLNGYILLKATTGDCPSQQTTSLSFVVYPIPVPALISGPTTVCAVTNGVVYSVNSVNDISYVWTVPNGVTITAGGGTNSITVDFGPGALSGNITVDYISASHPCPIPQSRIAVTVAPRPVNPTFTNVEVCERQTTVITAPLIAGATYTWTLSTEAILLSGQGTNSISVLFPTISSSGDLSLLIGFPDGCSPLEPNVIQAIVHPSPISNAGSDQHITTTSTTLDAAIPSSGSGEWTLLSGTATIVNATDPKTQVTNLGSGPNVFKWTTLYNACTSNDEVIINVDIAPTTNAIAGAQTVKYDSAYQFSVPFKEDETYEWTLEYEDPFSAEIVSGQNTNTLSVKFYGPITFGNSPLRLGAAGHFEISVEINNPFGTRVVSTSFGARAVTGLYKNSNKELSYAAYPNPFSDELTIKINSLNAEEVAIKILDTKGRVVYTSSDNYHTNELIQLKPDILPGIYEVHATSKDQISVFKIVKF